MARANQQEQKTKTVELVSPDGEIKRTVDVGSKEEVALRFDGFLPADQAKLEAPERPTAGAEVTVGSNA